MGEGRGRSTAAATTKKQDRQPLAWYPPPCILATLYPGHPSHPVPCASQPPCTLCIPATLYPVHPGHPVPWASRPPCCASRPPCTLCILATLYPVHPGHSVPWASWPPPLPASPCPPTENGTRFPFSVETKVIAGIGTEDGWHANHPLTRACQHPAPGPLPERPCDPRFHVKPTPR